MISKSWYDVSLCDCCLMALANNDTSGHESDCGIAAPVPLSNLRYVLAPNESAVPGDERDEFVTSPCDGCGEELAGARSVCPVLRDTRVKVNMRKSMLTVYLAQCDRRGHETVETMTSDRVELRGTYARTHMGPRRGTLAGRTALIRVDRWTVALIADTCEHTAGFCTICHTRRVLARAEA